MTMYRPVVVFAIVCFLALSMESGFAAPAQLYGKSIIISWTEQRDQKEPWNDFHQQVTRAGTFTIYVSTVGRVFTRMDYAGGRNKRMGYAGGGNKTPSDQVGGGSAVIHRVINFQGRSLSVTMPLEGGARNIAISFDDSFGGCSAEVLTGWAQGARKIVATSLNAGHKFEIFSIKTGPASCQIQTRNAFAP
jgi:hypothetical protein